MRALIVLLMLLAVSLSRAQTPPTLTTSTLLLFPDALLLEAAVSVSAREIQGITLSLRRGDEPPLTVAYPAQPYRFAAEFVVADYVLAFPSQPALPLLTEVQYRWVVRLTNGDQLTAAGSVLYDDPRVSWQEIASADGRVTFRAGAGLAVDLRAEAAQTAGLLQRVQQDTGREAAPVRWAFYSPAITPFCETSALAGQAGALPRHRFFWANREQEMPCDPDLAERVFAAAGYRVTSDAARPGFFSGLRRDVVERAYALLWPRDVPAWFREGLISLYLDRRVDDAGIVRQALRGSRPLTLAQLQQLPSRPADATLWHAQANTMLRYLLATHGVPPVFELARRLGEFPDFPAAYRAVLGQPLELLIPAWEAWVFTDAAVLAGSYSIYAVTTPTPTPSATPTATQPSPTPSLTPTASPTETPIPPTATRTRIPPTATRTPLPPETFIVRATPTAAPAPPRPALLLSDAPPAFFFGIGMAVLGAALLLAMLLRRH